MQLGWGSFMAKFDVQNAYRIVPVQGSSVIRFEMAGSLLCGHGTPFWRQVSPVYLHLLSRLSWVDCNTELWCHLFDALAWQLPYSWSPWLISLSTQSGQIYRLFLQVQHPSPPGQIGGAVYLHDHSRREGSWLLSRLVIFTMHVRSYLKAHLSCAGWLTCCALSVVMTTPFNWTGSSFST